MKYRQIKVFLPTNQKISDQIKVQFLFSHLKLIRGFELWKPGFRPTKIFTLPIIKEHCPIEIYLSVSFCKVSYAQ